MDLQIDGITYRTRKLSGIQQWELFRRLGPLMPILTAGSVNGVAPLPGGRFLTGNSYGMLSEMKQADSDYVLAMCLGAVDRRTQDDRQYRRMVVNDQFMFDDETDLGTMLELMESVIEENLGSFFARIRSASAEVAATEPIVSDSA